MNQKENDFQLNDKFIQIAAIVLLGFISFQPLVGMFTTFDMSSYEAFLEDIENYFYMKSTIVRIGGYIALVFAASITLLSAKLSVKALFRNLYAGKPWNIGFTLLLIWTIYNSVSVAPLKDIAMNGEAYRFEGLLSVIAYGGIFALASMITDEKLKRRWMIFSVGCAVVLGIASLYSLWAENPFVLSYMNRQITNPTGELSATFMHYNHYAYYLCITIMMTAFLYLSESKLQPKAVYLVLFAFQQYVLAVNGTRGSLVGVFLGMIFLGIFGIIRKERNMKAHIFMWLAAFLVFLLPGAGLGQRFFSVFGEATQLVTTTGDRVALGSLGTGRWYIWQQCLELIKMYPVKGFGLNMAERALWQLRDLADMPHNEYLQHTVELGLIGSGLYVFSLGALFVSVVKRIKKVSAGVVGAGCVAIAYGVSAFFGVTIVQVLPFFYIMLGFVKATEEGEQRESITDSEE